MVAQLAQGAGIIGHVGFQSQALTVMPPNNLERTSLAMDMFMSFIALLTVINWWLVRADGVIPRWRSAPGGIPRAGMVPRAGVVVRGCAMLDAASTNETVLEANEPKREDGGTWVASTRLL